MRRSLSMSVIGAICCMFAGCQVPVKVDLEGTNNFPAELVGTWKARNHDWQITFENDGTISSIHHMWGGIEIYPGKVNRLKGRGGGNIIITPGIWTVFYSEKDRSLTVEIILKHFEIEMGGGVLTGKQKDAFVGIIDGNNWEAEWINLPEYIAYVPEPHELPVFPEWNIKDPVLFEKVKE